MKRPWRIVVIDDNPDDRAEVRRLLLRGSDRRYEFFEAESGEEGIATIRRLCREVPLSAPVCVLLDFHLPDRDALEVLAELNDTPETPLCPIIVLTGTSDSDGRAVLQAGAQDYLGKNWISAPSLTRGVENALERWDMSNRLRISEAQERARRTEIETIMGAMPVAVFVAHDATFQKLSANRIGRSLLRLPLDQAPFSSINPTEFQGVELWFRGQRLPSDEFPMRRALATGTAFSGLEVDVVFPDGERKPNLVSAYPLLDENGVVRGCIGAFVDISQQARQQQQISDLNDRLQRSIGESHHRIKNNLQVLSAMIEIQSWNEESPENLQKWQRMSTHISALATLHDILTIESKTETDQETVPLRAAMERLVPMLSTVIGGKQIRCLIEDDIRLPLKQVSSFVLLVNELVSNASKHGGNDIEVNVRWQLSRPDREGVFIRLEVDDNGPGFPADFEPSQSANTGLELIQSLGAWDLAGEIHYENRPEGGARVTVIFPASCAPAVPS